MVLLSGTEPQRTILENKLILELKNHPKKIIFVRGILSDNSKLENTKTISFINFVTQYKLEKLINQSELVIARSGYSTIMDLAVLQKKAFFIPTPNQTEQEYLAKHLFNLKIAPFSNQTNFNVAQLNNIKQYTGFVNMIEMKTDFPFAIFKP